MDDNTKKAKEVIIENFFKKSSGMNNVLASGNQSGCEYGFVHTWFIDGPGAAFGDIEGGTQWEVVCCNKIEELGLNDYKNYKNFDEYKKDFESARQGFKADREDYKQYKEEYKKMKEFEKQLEDSYTTEFLEHPLNELEGFIRLW